MEYQPRGACYSCGSTGHQARDTSVSCRVLTCSSFLPLTLFLQAVTARSPPRTTSPATSAASPATSPATACRVVVLLPVASPLSATSAARRATLPAAAPRVCRWREDLLQVPAGRPRSGSVP
ncbi:hypothetical protein HDV57DRAFT_179477 [Trichoderma longibrachiatum]